MPKLNKARAVRILTSCTPLNVVQATWTNLLIDLVIEKIEQLTALEILHHIATCSERHLTEMPLSISEWGEHASNLNNLGIPGDFATSLKKKNYAGSKSMLSILNESDTWKPELHTASGVFGHVGRAASCSLQGSPKWRKFEFADWSEWSLASFFCPVVQWYIDRMIAFTVSWLLINGEWITGSLWPWPSWNKSWTLTFDFKSWSQNPSDWSGGTILSPVPCTRRTGGRCLPISASLRRRMLGERLSLSAWVSPNNKRCKKKSMPFWCKWAMKRLCSS